MQPYSEYWNPKNETLPRKELQALQLLKLRRFCEWTYANSPFHRRRFGADAHRRCGWDACGRVVRNQGVDVGSSSTTHAGI